MPYTVKIEWMTDYANNPTIAVTGKQYPNLKDYEFEKKDVGNQRTMYLGLLGDFARFFLHDAIDQCGFGGASYTLKMKDCTEETIIGPWSSNAGAVNRTFDTSLIEVRYNAPRYKNIAQALTLESILPYLPDSVTLIKDRNGTYIPILKGFDIAGSKEEIKAGRYQDTVYKY